MEGNSVLIIGAGAAGLEAARVLSSAGVPSQVLEARSRLGGRIYTIPSKLGQLPVELGAEFIHGEINETWDIVRAAGLPTHEVPDRHRRLSNHRLTELSRFWDELNRIFEQLNTRQPDQDFRSYLERNTNLDPETKRLAVQFVEGFHAAHADRIGIHALAKAAAAAERDKAARQFRITNGYAAMLEWFARQLAAHDVPVHYRTIVSSIRWEHGHVEVLANTPAGQHAFEASRAVVTLPLGVLKQTSSDAVKFEPQISEKAAAIQSLEMGTALKVVFEFRSRFWPIPNFGFIHAENEWLPTWWSDERGNLLTGWSGGPQAEQLAREGRDSIVDKGIQAMSRIFNVERQKIRDLLVADYTHDWSQDSFSRGAYSYTPVGAIDMPRRLAAPVVNTLFFAGEATDAEGEQGTVHAALASGRRAASEVLASLPAF